MGIESVDQSYGEINSCAEITNIKDKNRLFILVFSVFKLLKMIATIYMHSPFPREKFQFVDFKTHAHTQTHTRTNTHTYNTYTYLYIRKTMNRK